MHLYKVSVIFSLCLSLLLPRNSIAQCTTRKYDENDVKALRELGQAGIRITDSGQPNSWNEVIWEEVSGTSNCYFRAVEIRKDWTTTAQGIIPDAIGNLSKLRVLYLNNGKLRGKIPSAIGKLKELEELHLPYHEIEGPLPNELFELPKLRILILSDNPLGGEIPVGLARLKQLQSLILYESQLAGKIPNELFELPNLEVLGLGYNSLSGALPENLGNAKNLKLLNVVSNQLTGRIPISIESMHHLEILDLFDNNMEGPLPDFISANRNLREISLSGNNFTSINLTSIGYLTHLEKLSLSYNRLTGKFPMQIRNLKKIEVVDVRGNKLSLSDLEPFADQIFDREMLQLFPQDSIGDDRFTTFEMGDTYILEAHDSCAGNEYFWRKNGIGKFNFVTDNPKLPIPINTIEDAAKWSGTFTCEIRNLRFHHQSGMGVQVRTRKLIAVNNNSAILFPTSKARSYGGHVLDEPAKLLKEPAVKGGATDGVTKLLIVKPSQDPVVLQIHRNDEGTLSTLDGKSINQLQLTVNPVYVNNVPYVFAVYTVPDGYGLYPPGGRDAFVEIFPVDKPQLSKVTKISLHTPPVILVHGMWSNPKEAWQETGFQKYLRDRGFNVTDKQLADYSWNSHLTFDPRNIESLSGRSAVSRAIEYGIKYYFDSLQIAATQADVVAHSLGGLMARSFMSQLNHENRLNYFEGYVHKLITIGTPHHGSPVGPTLWEMKTADGIMSFFNSPIGTVHRDFDYKSQAYRNLDETGKSKNHAISTSFIPPDDRSKTMMEKMLFMLKNKPFSSIIFDGATNDGLVSEASQRGGISDMAKTHFYQTVHTPKIAGSFLETASSQTNSPLIQQRVVELLYSADDAQFSHEWKNKSLTSGRIAQTQNEAVNYIPAIKLSTLDVRLTSPQPLATIENNETFLLSFDTIGTNNIESSLFLIANSDISMPDDHSFQSAYQLTSPIPPGEIPIAVFARNDQQKIFSDTIKILTPIPDTFFDYTYFPSSITLDSISTTQQIYLSARVTTGTGTVNVDLTQHVFGATFASTYGKVSIDKNGLMQAKGTGADTVEVTHGTVIIRIPVYIESVGCKSKAQNIAISGETNPCINQEYQYSVKDLNSQVIWSSPGFGTLTSDDNGTKINWSQPGEYKLIVSKMNECGLVDNFDITIHANKQQPPQPEIQFRDGQLYSSEENNNQWFFNGKPISNENAQSMEPLESGAYSVQTLSDCGKSLMSEAYHYVISAVGETMTCNLVLYPNPTDDSFYIKSLSPISSVEVTGILGNKLLSIDIKSEDFFFNSEHWPSGTYFLKITTNCGEILKRITIVR